MIFRIPRAQLFKLWMKFSIIIMDAFFAFVFCSLLFWPSNEDRPLKALELQALENHLPFPVRPFELQKLGLLGKLKIYIYDQQCSSFSRLIIAATPLAIWLPSMMTIMLVEVEPKKKKQLLLVFWVVDVQKENDCNFDLDDVPKCRRSCLPFFKPKKLGNYN